MEYAGKNALRESYGGGHYGTVAAHSERWGQFSAWAKENGIKDARDVTKEAVERYGSTLSERVGQGKMAVSYAQNLLSSVNTTMTAMREDDRVWVSPSTLVGERSSVRDVAPLAMSREAIQTCAAALREDGHARAATVLETARELGTREREGVMLDYKSALREAVETGKVSIEDGTKGGRSAERQVLATPTAIAALERGAALQTELGGRNLISPAESYSQVLQELDAARDAIAAHDQRGFHDSRAAFACERYQQLTGTPAPVNSPEGRVTADRVTDRAARQQIAYELGHNRIDVVAEYIGGTR